MTRLTRTWLAVAAVAALPLSARAEAGGKGLGDFSVVGAEINTGKPVESVEVGWPGLNFGYDLNLSKTMDITPTFSLLWGIEGSTYTAFGLGASAPIRFDLGRVFPEANARLLFHVDPGVAVFFGGTGGCIEFNIFGECISHGGVGGLASTAFGFTFPVGVVLGFPVAHGLEVGGGLDVNLAVVVTSPFNFLIGPWAGPYVEYHFDNPKIAIGLNTRFGAAINTASGVGTWFAFMTEAFVAYRLF
jgi:hypothetical protein